MQHTEGHERSGARPRTLLFSERNIYEQAVWRCPFYEFETLLPAVDSVEVLAPSPQHWYRTGKRVASKLGRYFKTPINPGVGRIRLTGEYDLFLAICEKPSELLNLQAIEGLKDCCRTSVCWVVEFYPKDIPIFKSALSVLSRFDYVVFMFDTNEPFRRFVSGEAVYLPAGVDAFAFCPYPNPPPRSVEVFSFGRRSARTHQTLLAMAREESKYYVYDSIRGLEPMSLAEHRWLVASTAKRSRYVIANPGKVDATDETGGTIEFGYRHFEGAAAGAILIGQRPNNRQFSRYFDWEDAVIDLPFDSDRIRNVMRDLDAQPERMIRARRHNIVQSLLRHDWVYRWEALLTLVGLEPLPQLVERKERLAALAALVNDSPIEP